MEETKTEGQKLQELLLYKPANAWGKYSDEDKKAAFAFCEGYKRFLDIAKTEREFVVETARLAGQHGFILLDDIVGNKKKIDPGMKIYSINHKKSVILAIIGKHPLDEGVNLVGAHIDSPRMDLKQNPVYEDTEMALLKTRYYGGIKKYQWLAIPLAIHGVVIKGNGDVTNIVVGEDENDPVFTITDLLPHLAGEQMQKKMSEAVSGEGLNVLIGSIPYNDEKVKDKVKLNLLNLLNQKYGIKEEDFQSAELEIVPAFKAKDIGFDRGMIGAYGQDDRVCAYTSLIAALALENIEKTSVLFLTDKEETGSVGNTGADSKMLEDFLAYLCAYSTDNYSDINLRRCLGKSRMLSADVNAGVDPNYEEVNDKRNAIYMGRGVSLQKYPASSGKYGVSDANAEFIGELRILFNSNGVMWQSGEFGKVDQGGGGTIAKYMAKLGIDVIDCGVPVLSMHSPFEITNKIDIYTAYKAYKLFFENEAYFYEPI